MASSWAAFVATGNPSLPGLNREQTDPDTNKATVWDNECLMVDDPDGEAPKIITRGNRLGRDHLSGIYPVTLHNG